MGYDDRIPVFGCCTGNKTLTFCFDEICLVRHENSRCRIEHEKFTRHLCKAVAGDHDNGLTDQSKAFLLHHGSRHGKGFSCPHSMGHVGAP